MYFYDAWTAQDVAIVNEQLHAWTAQNVSAISSQISYNLNLWFLDPIWHIGFQIVFI